MKFHHIGVATRDLNLAISIYSDLGYELQNKKIHMDHIQRVQIAFMEADNHPLIELLMPHGENSPVENILNKNGATPYHTCYEVQDLQKTIYELQKLKFIPIIKPTPAIAFNNRLICFLYSKTVGLIELLQAM